MIYTLMLTNWSHLSTHLSNGNEYHSTSRFFRFFNITMINAQSTAESKLATAAPEAELFEIVRTAKKMT